MAGCAGMPNHTPLIQSLPTPNQFWFTTNQDKTGSVQGLGSGPRVPPGNQLVVVENQPDGVGAGADHEFTVPNHTVAPGEVVATWRAATPFTGMVSVGSAMAWGRKPNVQVRLEVDWWGSMALVRPSKPIRTGLPVLGSVRVKLVRVFDSRFDAVGCTRILVSRG